MSYDFTVLIPELIGTHEEALSLHNAMCEQPDTSVPDNVQRFIDELNAKYGYQNDDDQGFSAWHPSTVTPGARWYRLRSGRYPRTGPRCWS
ncbi:hypothetical protein EB73_16375 [Mycobacterium sp. SWH-M3]|nr:hypothetical protein EB73_16375 [Mycobacterium sp. SWH-M3]